MEASALTHASQRGLLARRSPLLKLQGDEKLIAMVRSGNAGAFETIVDRYQGRLLGFCRQMLGSTEDAEDVLQEVFVNAYKAMLNDEREINLRPWLYRIARNRCLNHLRKPTADAQESMDMVPMVEAASTAEKVHNREEFRQLLADVSKLPETQRSALLLREMDAMSYEEIAQAMDTSVPSVKSLLVRARISLAEASQARQLTCGEVRLELAEAAEGLRKVSGPVRRHVRDCEECADFRAQVRTNDKVMAALFPVGPLLAFKAFLAGKLGLGGASGGAGASAAGAAGGTAATTGAVEVKQQVDHTPMTPNSTATLSNEAAPAIAQSKPAVQIAPAVAPPVEEAVSPTPIQAEVPATDQPTTETTVVPVETDETADQPETTIEEASVPTGEAPAVDPGTAQEGTTASGGTVVVTVGGSGATEEAPPAESTPPPPVETQPEATPEAPAPPAEP